MREADRIDGEFDDILGPDVPKEYKKESINRKLIKAYERVVARIKEKENEDERKKMNNMYTEKEKLLWKLEKISEIH